MPLSEVGGVGTPEQLAKRKKPPEWTVFYV
jgi:hypothetical protein